MVIDLFPDNYPFKKMPDNLWFPEFKQNISEKITKNLYIAFFNPEPRGSIVPDKLIISCYTEDNKIIIFHTYR